MRFRLPFGSGTVTTSAETPLMPAALMEFAMEVSESVLRLTAISASFPVPVPPLDRWNVPDCAAPAAMPSREPMEVVALLSVSDAAPA